MGVRFDATGNGYSLTTTLPPSQTVSVCAWAKVTTIASGDFEPVFSLVTPSSGALTSSAILGFGGNSSTAGHVAFFSSAGGSQLIGAASSVRVANLSYVFMAYTQVGTSVFGFWGYPGAGLIASAKLTGDSFTPAGLGIGYDFGGGDALVGSVAGVRIWLDQLTQADFEREMRSVRVVREYDCWAEFPLDSNIDLFDRQSKALILTPINTADVFLTAGPQVPYWPQERPIVSSNVSGSAPDESGLAASTWIPDALPSVGNSAEEIVLPLGVDEAGTSAMLPWPEVPSTQPSVEDVPTTVASTTAYEDTQAALLPSPDPQPTRFGGDEDFGTSSHVDEPATVVRPHSVDAPSWSASRDEDFGGVHPSEEPVTWQAPAPDTQPARPTASEDLAYPIGNEEPSSTALASAQATQWVPTQTEDLVQSSTATTLDEAGASLALLGEPPRVALYAQEEPTVVPLHVDESGMPANMPADSIVRALASNEDTTPPVTTSGLDEYSSPAVAYWVDAIRAVVAAEDSVTSVVDETGATAFVPGTGRVVWHWARKEDVASFVLDEWTHGGARTLPDRALRAIIVFQEESAPGLFRPGFGVLFATGDVQRGPSFRPGALAATFFPPSEVSPTVASPGALPFVFFPSGFVRS